MKTITKIIAAIFFSAFICGEVYAKPLSIDECLEATCRISVPTGKGSGVVVHTDENYHYIMTNAHVTAGYPDVKVEFFVDGFQSPAYDCNVIWRRYSGNTSIDIAVVTLDKRKVNFNPRVIPLAPESYVVQANDKIYTSGCPEGRWPTGWIGRVKAINGGRIEFMPPPVPGRSGSGLFVLVPDHTGELHTRVGGLIAWLIGPPGNQYGAGLSLNQIYALLNGQQSYSILPDIYSEISTSSVCPKCKRDHSKLCPNCGKKLGNHVVGSDGKPYCLHNGQINLPEGVKYRGLVSESQCPGGNCPLNPFRPHPANPLNPSPPPNDQGNPPNIRGEQPQPSPPERCERCEILEAQIYELTQSISFYKGEIARAEAQFQKIKLENAELFGKYDSLADLYEDVKNGKVNLQEQLDKLKAENNNLTVSLEKTIKTAEESFSKVEFLEEELVKLEEEKSLYANKMSTTEEEVEELTFWNRLWAGLSALLASLMSGFGVWKGIKYVWTLKTRGSDATLEMLKENLLKKLNEHRGDASEFLRSKQLELENRVDKAIPDVDVLDILEKRIKSEIRAIADKLDNIILNKEDATYKEMIALKHEKDSMESKLQEIDGLKNAASMEYREVSHKDVKDNAQLLRAVDDVIREYKNETIGRKT